MGNWSIEVIGQARKAQKNLSKRSYENFLTLLYEFEISGPYRSNWPNYTVMKRKNVEHYHCHIEKGRPTYVVCWIYHKSQKIIQVTR